MFAQYEKQYLGTHRPDLEKHCNSQWQYCRQCSLSRHNNQSHERCHCNNQSHERCHCNSNNQSHERCHCNSNNQSHERCHCNK